MTTLYLARILMQIISRGVVTGQITGGHHLNKYVQSKRSLVRNDIQCLPTYFTSAGFETWPNLKVSRIYNPSLITNWEISDEVTDSNHRYVAFRICADVVRQKINGFKTKSQGIFKFEQLLISNRLRLNCLFRDIHDDTQFMHLQSFYNEVLAIDSKSSRRKDIKNNPQSTWWTPVLRTQRSKVKALHRRLRNVLLDEG